MQDRDDGVESCIQWKKGDTWVVPAWFHFTHTATAGTAVSTSLKMASALAHVYSFLVPIHLQRLSDSGEAWILRVRGLKLAVEVVLSHAV